MSSAIDSLMIGLGRLLAYEPCASRMLRSPFWTGTTHVVQLRPIRIEQRGREPAPSPNRCAQDPPRGRAREQHSRDIRVCEGTHFGSPSVATSIAVLTDVRKVAKQELMDRVWPNVFVEAANLTVHISALRRALRDGRDGNRFIINIPGRGYRFVASIQVSMRES